MAVFSYDQASDGFTGALSTAKNADRLYFRAAKTFWHAVITGTDSKIDVTSDFGRNGSLIFVSVDGQPFVSAARQGVFYTLFSGLSDTDHEVFFYIGSIYSNAAYTSSVNQSFIDVQGSSPQVRIYSNTHTAFELNANVLDSGYYTDNQQDYLPQKIPDSRSFQASSPAFMFKSSAINIYFVMGGEASLYVSADGADASAITPSVFDDKISFHSIVTDGNEHTYRVWSNVTLWAVGCDRTFLPLNGAARLDQFGDSITHGGSADPSPKAEVDINNVAASFGRLGQAYGVPGWNPSDLLENLPDILSGSDRNANDVAVLAVGRNSTDIESNTQAQSDYADCITSLLDANYSKVLCRGILPDAGGATIWTAENDTIENIVSDYNDERVVFIDVDSWTGIDTTDDVHPSADGYETIEAYARTAYAPHLFSGINVTADDISLTLDITEPSASASSSALANDINLSIDLNFPTVSVSTNVDASNASIELLISSPQVTTGIQTIADDIEMSISIEQPSVDVANRPIPPIFTINKIVIIKG